MTSVHDLSDEELRAELERTRDAYAEYVRDVGEHPSHSTVDLDDGARLHLEVREELDRRAIGHHDAPLRWDAGGQAGGGHVDPAEQVAARRASYERGGDSRGGESGGGGQSGGGGGGPDGSQSGGGGGGPDGSQSGGETSGGDAGSGRSQAGHEDLPDKLDPGEIEPYA